MAGVPLSSVSICSSLLERSQDHFCLCGSKEKILSHLLLNGLHDTEHTFGARLTRLRTSLEDFLRRPWVNTHFAFVLPFGGFLLKS